MNSISALSLVLLILGFYIGLSIFIILRIVRPLLARQQSDRENTT